MNDLHLPPDVDATDPEGTVESCPSEAAWRHLVTSPADHLCEAHKAEREERYREEHGEVPPPVGLDDVDRFLPVEEDATCEVFDPETMGDCGAPADWVSVDTYSHEACQDHYARERKA